MPNCLSGIRFTDGVVSAATPDNTMAHSVIIGERAGQILRAAHKLSDVEVHVDQVAPLH